MKILFIDHDRRNSGSTVSVKYFLERLISDGYELNVICTYEKVKYYKHSFGYSNTFKIIPYYNFDLNIHFSDKYYFKFKSLSKIFKNIVKLGIGVFKSFNLYYNVRPDLVIVNEYVGIHLSFFIALNNIPIICFIRSKIYDHTPFISKIIKNVIQNMSTALICISEIEASQFSKKNNNIYILKESVNIYPMVYRKYDCNPLRFVFVGGINEIKGTYIVLSAFRVLIEQGVKINLIIVGHIEYSNEKYFLKCQDIITKYPFNIKVLDEQLDLQNIYSSSDILVSATTESHYSRPILEAFASGLAVIASDVPHNKLLVRNYENGLLFENGSSEALVVLLSIILQKPSILEKLIFNGYNAIQNYSQPLVYLEFKRIIQKYIALK